MEFSLRFKEGPPWCDRLVFSRDGDEIVVGIVRTSGTQLAEARLSAVKFNQMADLLLTAE